MFGYIYITTNLVNNKKYIGKHQASAFDAKYFGSGTVLLQAIKKYGKKNFCCQILTPVNNVATCCETSKQLNESEKFYINYYDCVNDHNYYNCKAGGDGGSAAGVKCFTNILTGEHRRVLNVDIDEYLNNPNWVMKGYIPSEDLKTKRALSNTGKKRSKETCEKNK